MELPSVQQARTVQDVFEMDQEINRLQSTLKVFERIQDETMRGRFHEQWAANAAVTGGHPFEPPAWAEIAEEGRPLAPFVWDDGRRAVLRAELDALYGRLYGLTRDEMRYILDPADVYGEEFPGETFRVLKEKEIKKFGEYRTRRLVLEAWDRMGAG